MTWSSRRAFMRPRKGASPSFESQISVLAGRSLSQVELFAAFRSSFQAGFAIDMR